MNDNADLHVNVTRFRRPLPVGSGPARLAYLRLVGEGFDQVLSASVVYSIAEGFSRESGNPPGDPMRFHEHVRRHAGAELPDGLDEDLLVERARDAMADPALLDAMDVGEIEEVAMVIGADMHRDAAAPAP